MDSELFMHAVGQLWHRIEPGNEARREAEYQAHLKKEDPHNQKNELLRVKQNAKNLRRYTAMAMGGTLGLYQQGLINSESMIHGGILLSILTVLAFGLNVINDHWMQQDINRVHNRSRK